MPLDKARLSQDIAQAFSDAKANAWSGEQTADALAAAIDTYVNAAVVGGISVSVVSNGVPVANGSVFGTGTQVGTVKLQ
jgi:hypothetical protein